MYKYAKHLLIALAGTMLLLVGHSRWQEHVHDKQVRDLQNKIAEQAVTIQVKEQVYEKMAADQKNLQGLIDKSTQQGKELSDRLKETKSQVLALSSAVLSANAKLDRALSATPNQDGSWSAAVNEKNGPLYLRGTIAAGPKAEDGIRPSLDFGIEDLNIDLVVSRSKDGTWKVDGAVPKPLRLNFKNVRVDTSVTAPRWYERFNFTLQLASTPGFEEGLASAGVGYKLGQFNLSALSHFSSAGDKHGYLGLGIAWFPWER